MFKIATEGKKLKTMGYITLFMAHYPRKEKMEILIPCSDMHANQSNGYYIKLFEGCIEITLQHPIK